MNEQQIKDLIKNWYNNKARNEQDQFFKFMSLWICFNAWLDHEAKKSNDRQMINWLKEQTADSSELMRSYIEMTQTTIGANALAALVSMSPVRDSRGRYDDINIQGVADHDKIIEAIYRIRCNLFHGGKSSTDTRDEKLLTFVNQIMSKWMADLVSRW